MAESASSKHAILERIKQAVGAERGRPEELAAKVPDLNASTVRSILREERTPNVHTAALIAQATGVEPAWLLLGQGPMRAGDAVGEDAKAYEAEPSETSDLIRTYLQLAQQEEHQCARLKKLETDMAEMKGMLEELLCRKGQGGRKSG